MRVHACVCRPENKKGNTQRMIKTCQKNTQVSLKGIQLATDNLSIKINNDSKDLQSIE